MYIGLLEDDPHIAQDVRDLLEGAGHKVRDFDNGGEMISALSRDTLDLFVLDWWVPEKTGIQVLGHIRGTLGLTTPVLFLTSRSDEKDIVAALNAGADDYCTKPIQSQVLLARIAALLRRTYPDHDSKSHKEYLGYTFNPADQTVTFGSQVQTLTDKEFNLALYFFQNAERAISRKRLMLELWGEEGDALSRALDVHVSAVRKKLALSATSTVARLRPIYGFGYRLVSVQSGDDDE